MVFSRGTVALVAVCLAAGTQDLLAQTGPLAPPVVVDGAGGFSARRLETPPRVDGRNWISIEVASAVSSTTLAAPDRSYTLTLADAGQDTGDFERYKLLFKRKDATPVRVDDHFTGWFYVTPDSRHVFMEPLVVLDVLQWRKYELSKVLGISNYTTIMAISRDRKRLLISRVECAIDCPGQPVHYYELRFPL